MALERLSKSVCPGCRRPVDLKNTEIDFCPHCGIGLFDHCGNCHTRKAPSAASVMPAAPRHASCCLCWMAGNVPALTLCAAARDWELSEACGKPSSVQLCTSPRMTYLQRTNPQSFEHSHGFKAAPAPVALLPWLMLAVSLLSAAAATAMADGAGQWVNLGGLGIELVRG